MVMVMVMLKDLQSRICACACAATVGSLLLRLPPPKTKVSDQISSIDSSGAASIDFVHH